MKKVSAIILAAGKGKRMRSTLPKVLQNLMGRPLIYYVIAELLGLSKYIKQIIVVTGYQDYKVKQEVRKYFPTSLSKINFVHQSKLDGTAKAVKLANRKAKNPNLLVVCGDTPLVTKSTLSKFISFCLRGKLAAGLITAVMNKNNSLGVVSYDDKGKLKSVTERTDLKGSRGEFFSFSEVNSGIYYFKRKGLAQNLAAIKRNSKKKEYFLTDLIEIFYRKNSPLRSYLLADSQEIIGINTQSDLVLARGLMQKRILEGFINKGVKVIDSETTFIEAGAKVGKNTIIYPFTFIEKGVIIGSNCSLGPFARLRRGTSIGDNSQIGDFIEINRSKIGRNVTMKHFGYLGDAVVEDSVNIGAGTVTANYDGKKKWQTHIRKGCFVGSDSILVAPVELGKNSKTGAGSVVTKNVLSGETVAGVPAKRLRKKR